MSNGVMSIPTEWKNIVQQNNVLLDIVSPRPGGVFDVNQLVQYRVSFLTDSSANIPSLKSVELSFLKTIDGNPSGIDIYYGLGYFLTFPTVSLAMNEKGVIDYQWWWSKDIDGVMAKITEGVFLKNSALDIPLVAGQKRDGEYLIKFKSTDDLGNTENTENLDKFNYYKYIIDNTPPKVSDLSNPKAVANGIIDTKFNKKEGLINIYIRLDEKSLSEQDVKDFEDPGSANNLTRGEIRIEGGSTYDSDNDQATPGNDFKLRRYTGPYAGGGDEVWVVASWKINPNDNVAGDQNYDIHVKLTDRAGNKTEVKNILQIYIKGGIPNTLNQQVVSVSRQDFIKGTLKEVSVIRSGTSSNIRLRNNVEWGGVSENPGSPSYSKPFAIAATEKNIFMSDIGSNNIIRLSSSMAKLKENNELASKAEGIASDGQFVYIADTGKNRILKVDLALSRIYAEYAVESPNSIAVDSQKVYFTTKNGTLTALNKSLAIIGTPLAELSGEALSTKLRVAADGNNVYLLNIDSVKGNKIFHLSNSLTLRSTYADAGVTNDPRDITTDGSYLYISENGKKRVARLDIDDKGYLIFKDIFMGENNKDPGGIITDDLTEINGISTDGYYTYICETGKARIVVTGDVAKKVQWNELSQFGDGTAGNTEDRLSSPMGVTIGGAYVYVADAGNNRVVMLKNDLSFIKTSSNGLYNSPKDVYYNEQGVYVVDSAGISLSTDDVQIKARSLGITANGATGYDANYLLVTSGNNIAQLIDDGTSIKFNKNLTISGLQGPAALNGPVGITTNGIDVYVCDNLNNRVVKFKIDKSSPTNHILVYQNQYSSGVTKPQYITLTPDFLYFTQGGTAANSVVKLDLNLNYIDKFTGTSGLSALRGVTAYDQYCLVVEQGKHRLVKTGISKFAGEVAVEDSGDDAAMGNSNHSLVLLTNSEYNTYPLVVYEKNVSGTQKIYFKIAKDEDATEYSEENVISEGTQFAVTSSKSKRAYMAFIKSGKVMFSMNDGCDEPVGSNTSFSTPVIVSGAQTGCANPSITVDKDNHVYIAWESGGKIHYNLSVAAITQKVNAMTAFSDTNIVAALCGYDGDLSNISISADRVGNKVYAACVLTKDGNSNVMFGKGSSEKGSITSTIILDKVPINGAEGEKIS
ncbi:MAG TPA: hypothetical protein PKL57_11555, partial [Candidatus Wallbacteria bacterium]|nr:hypothetical protein [Candidatus Wallbacteria bacterium]